MKNTDFRFFADHQGPLQKITFTVLGTAFLISAVSLLSACGGSGGSSLSTSASTTTSTPTAAVIDLTQNKLLNDSELNVNSFPNLPSPPSEEFNWLTTHHQKLRSLTYDGDFSDLAFLDPLLRNKRIVQLGESSHGTREFNQAKVRLIKYLHEKLGYNVIAFEASAIGCYLQEREFELGKTFRVDESCIFSVWSTREVQELIDYIARTQKTANPLRIAGFDEQYSGNFDAPNVVKPWVQSALNKLNEPGLSTMPDIVEQSIIVGLNGSNCISDNTSPQCAKFYTNYASRASELSNLAALLKPYVENATFSDKTNLQMVYLTLTNLQKRLEVTKQSLDRRNYFEPRDKVMADNINALANTIYPQEKIMVWAHNSHITHGISGYGDTGRSMGSFLVSTWGNQLYSIGLFMLRGETANNDRTIIQVQAPLGGSLEAKAASLKLAAFFLPLPSSDQPGSGDDWIFQPISFFVWGKYPTVAPISEQFNALLFVDHSSMPVYVQ